VPGSPFDLASDVHATTGAKVRGKPILILTLAALVVAMVAAPAVARPATPPGLPVQLSLGDSWGSGVGAPTGEGYVDQLHDLLRTGFDCSPAASPNARGGCAQLQLVNLSQGGATTTSLIAQQLDAATSLLEQRNQDRNPRNDVEVVTLHIGGNDVTNPIIQACVLGQGDCQATIAASFQAYAVDLDHILAALREAAGPDTPIVLGTYDNPIPTCQLSSPTNDVLGAQVLAELHALMAAVAAPYDVTIADVSGQLEADDWVGGQDCLHPVASGYTKVADAFVDALDLG
jgi:lysophospholipase L1-like esterase